MPEESNTTQQGGQGGQEASSPETRSGGSKAILWIVIAIIIIGGIWYSTTKKSAEEETIKIGIIQTLTGNSAQYGQWALEGIKMATDEVNDAGGIDGKNLELVVEDDTGDNAKAVAAAEKLISIDGVKLIIGPTLSSTCMTVAPIAEKNRVLMFVTVAGTSDLKEAGDYIFRNRDSAEINGKTMAEFAYDELGLRKIALAYVNAPNGITYTKAFREHFLELGGTITNDETYEKDTTDFRTILAKISKKEPEAIYVSAWITETAFLVKQIKEQGLEFKFLTTLAAETPKLFEIAGDAAEGIYLTSPAFDPESEDPVIAEYLANYKELYGQDSNVFAGNSYDAVKILAQAIQELGYDADAIRDYLYTLEDYPGVSGTSSFDEYGEAKKPIMIKTVKDGEFVPYE